jgi:Spy/CpxP family protein refolding chaperone
MIGNTAKAKLLVFAVFFVGAVTGALIQNVYMTRLDVADAAPEKRSQREVNQVYDFLALDAKQRQQWTRIMDEVKPEVSKLLEENRNLTAPNRLKIEAIQEQTRSKVRAILSEEQKKMYNDFNERRRQRQTRPRPQ